MTVAALYAISVVLVAAFPEEHGQHLFSSFDPGPVTTASAEIPLRVYHPTDLTERARKGQIDPVTGRDEEILQIVDILMRRRQNNPILTGEAGVGKTAVVEGFALRLARGDVPPPLREVSLHTLDIGLLHTYAWIRDQHRSRVEVARFSP